MRVVLFRQQVYALLVWVDEVRVVQNLVVLLLVVIVIIHPLLHLLVLVALNQLLEILLNTLGGPFLAPVDDPGEQAVDVRKVALGENALQHLEDVLLRELGF